MSLWAGVTSCKLRPRRPSTHLSNFSSFYLWWRCYITETVEVVVSCILASQSTLTWSFLCACYLSSYCYCFRSETRFSTRAAGWSLPSALHPWSTAFSPWLGLHFSQSDYYRRYHQYVVVVVTITAWSRHTWVAVSTRLHNCCCCRRIVSSAQARTIRCSFLRS